MGPRLKSITTFIGDEYDEVWDTCCDHGYLGMALLQKNIGSKVFFVDRVPSIIENLKSNIAKTHLNGRYKIRLMDAALIRPEGDKPLVCITGVGGDTVVDIISKIIEQNPKKTADFLICSQNRNYEIRSFLKEEGFKQNGQMLSFENGKGYEILRSSYREGDPIELIGQSMFDLKNKAHRVYLERQHRHYSQCIKSNESMAEAHKLYSKVLHR